MAKTRYSKEEFEEVDESLREVKESIAGDKSVQELRNLVDNKEKLESLREQLITDAQTEARFINIFIDTFESEYAQDGKTEPDLESFLINYASRLAVNESQKVQLDLALSYALLILEQKVVGENDFEKLTELVSDMKSIAQSVNKGSHATIETTNEEEVTKKRTLTVRTKELIYENNIKNVQGQVTPSKFYVNAIGNEGNAIKVDIGNDLRRALSISNLTPARRDLARSSMPKELEVVESVNEWGNKSYKLTEAQLRSWVGSIENGLPKQEVTVVPDNLDIPIETVDGQFLPPGQWVDGAAQNYVIETRNTNPSVSDPERIPFFKGLRPERIVNCSFFTGRDKKVFSAYVYSRQGRKVAVIATDITNNADYVFWADDDSWIDVAQNGRLEIITGSYPQFVDRLIHSGGWQVRLEEFLSGKRETLKVKK